MAAIFEVKKLDSGAKNVASLVNLLKSEGLEILSLETRPLDIQEAMFIKNRKICEEDAELATLVNNGFDVNHQLAVSI